MKAANWHELGVLTLLWFAYFALHSALAALPVKRAIGRLWPRAMPFYRLAFNLVALLTLVPIAVLVWRADSPLLWAWTGNAAWFANGVALAALASVVFSRQAYDTGLFIGWRQWQTQRREVDDGERFRLSPYHRYVRHPWYFIGLVLIWTRDMNALTLASAVALTLYLIVGSRLEEMKLVHAHGESYRRYMARVPGLLPRPWPSINAAEADHLVTMAVGGSAGPTPDRATRRERRRRARTVARQTSGESPSASAGRSSGT